MNVNVQVEERNTLDKLTGHSATGVMKAFVLSDIEI
jgi:hypothetical protein